MRGDTAAATWRKARLYRANMQPVVWLGIFLIIVGAALVLLPTLAKHVDLSRVPSWIIYVYKHDGFYFVTSPLLIIISIISVIVYILTR